MPRATCSGAPPHSWTRRIRCDHDGILVIRAEISNLFDGDQTYVVTEPRGNPAQMAAVRVQPLGELLKQALKSGRDGTHMLLQPRDRGRESRRRERLQHIVDCSLLEGCNRIFVVSCNKHDMAASARLAGDHRPAVA